MRALVCTYIHSQSNTQKKRSPNGTIFFDFFDLFFFRCEFFTTLFVANENSAGLGHREILNDRDCI